MSIIRACWSVTITATSLMLAAPAGSQPPLATGRDANVSEDGLHLVDPSAMEGAWVLPDLDLSRYSKVYFYGTGVGFRDVAGPDVRTGSRFESEEFPVSPETQQEIRATFRQTFFDDLHDLDRFEFAELPDRDVLVAQGFLVDVVSRIPPQSAGGRSTTLQRTYEATIVLELRDSMSHDILARTVERELPQGSINASDIPRETRLLLGRWSRLLTERLEELAEIAGD